MAISFVAAGTVATGANPTVGVPAGIAAGDLLLLVNTGTTTPTNPTGWTRLSAQGAGQFITIAYKYASASETSVAVTQSGTTTKAVMLAYRGGGAFQIVPAYTTGTGTTATPNTLTTTYTNDYVISMYACASGGVTNFTANGSTTSRVNSGGTSTLRGLLIADELKATAGVTTARAATLSASRTWASVAIGLIESRTVYWVGGTGTWDASSTTNWADSTGGAGGVVPPSPWDSATIDTSSGTGTITCTAATCLNLSVTASQAISLGGSQLSVYGSSSFPSGGSFSVSTNITFAATTSGNTVTSNGKTFSSLDFNGVGGSWTLGDEIAGVTNFPGLTVTNGTFNTGNFNITTNNLRSTNSNVRTINLGSSTVTLPGVGTPLDFATSTNLTFNAGTSQITFTANLSGMNGGGQTFYNVSYSRNANGFSMTGANTFNDLTVTTTGNTVRTFTLAANQTVNGTLNVAGLNSTTRMFVLSNTVGTTRTITAATISANDCDFRDITIAGGAAGSSPTRAGDCGGNSGITFPAPKTVYWNRAAGGSWTDSFWATTIGGTTDSNNFPLAQDTAVFDSTGLNNGATVDLIGNPGYNIGTIDMSARTVSFPMTLGGNTSNIYGNWINGTGTTLTNQGTLNFFGRTAQSITTAGATFTQPIVINAVGTVSLIDNFITSNTFTLTTGTFDASNQNVTVSTFASNNSNIRTLTMGSGTWSLTNTAASTIWNCATSTNLTVTATTSTIDISGATAANAITFAGGGRTYGNLSFTNTSATGTITFTGSNTFSTLSSSRTSAYIISFTASTTTTVSNWTIKGSVGNLVTIQSATASNHTLAKAGAGVVDANYLSISRSTATPATLTWYAGANSTNGGNNSGWIFANAPIVSNGNFFLMFA